MSTKGRGSWTLSYDDAGNGRALLFVHGWPLDRTIWLGQLGGLAIHARCIVPDLRGFGGSPGDDAGSATIDGYADDLVHLLDALAIPRAVVCGLSMGGYVALSLLGRHPSRVDGLILADTRAGADSAEQRATRERLIAFVQAQGIPALADQQLDKMVGSTTRASRPELCEMLRRMMAGAPPRSVVGAQRAMLVRRDWSAALASIAVPTLVVAGAEDAIIPVAEQRAMADAIPGAQWVEIPGAGHVAPFERPAAFNHAVTEFLLSMDG